MVSEYGVNRASLSRVYRRFVVLDSTSLSFLAALNLRLLQLRDLVQVHPVFHLLIRDLHQKFTPVKLCSKTPDIHPCEFC